MDMFKGPFQLPFLYHASKMSWPGCPVGPPAREVAYIAS